MALAVSKLKPAVDSNLLVGLDTADDAAVYRLEEGKGIVCTVDILAPVVDDARTFGRIAAANCLSDVYAMGGEPFLALNVAGFPSRLDASLLGEILAGGQEKAEEAGVTVAGGHTFSAEGIMYGMCVIGRVEPRAVVTNAGARPGDLLVLTKPIGVGTLVQAMVLKERGLDFQPVIQAMSTLNRPAARAMIVAGAHAATDITGYGLAGHLVEMAEASAVGVELWGSRIPVHEDVAAVLGHNIYEPGIAMNQGSFGGKVTLEPAVARDLDILVFGSETSGGLAVAMPESRVEIFAREFGRPAPVVGRVTADDPGRVRLIPGP